MSEFPYSLSVLVLFGIAAASLWKLVVADRITRFVRYRMVKLSRRAQKHRGIGFVAYHIEYAVGCALCSPMWLMMGMWWVTFHDLPGRHDFTFWADAAIFVLGGRFVAYALLRYFQETKAKDWPAPFTWPPKPRKDEVEAD